MREVEQAHAPDACTGRQSRTEWIPDADGIPSREAARVLVIDPDNRVLLIRGHDIDRPDFWWWFTVGGGIQGQSRREGAVRELYEETGLRAQAQRLIGPVLYRRAVLKFTRGVQRQNEYFFLLRVTAAEASSVVAGKELSALEQELLDEYRWWDASAIEEAERAGEIFYPVGLGALVQGWINGWDGTCDVIDENDTAEEHGEAKAETADEAVAPSRRKTPLRKPPPAQRRAPTGPN